MEPDLNKIFQDKFIQRNYRKLFNSSRFSGFEVKYHETDLWIGVDQKSFKNEMKEVAQKKIESLRQHLDEYIAIVPDFKKTLKPFRPQNDAPFEVKEMAQAAELAGIGPMSAVAGLFAREAGREIIKNFSPNELVVENGGDIYVSLEKDLILSVFAGNSPLSERIGIVIPGGAGRLGICTSAGTVGPSLSFGKADAVVVICDDILLADAFATSFGNKVKSPQDVEKVIDLTEKYPEIRSMLIICEDQVGIKGEFEIKILK